MMRPDIFDIPRGRSTKSMGSSTIWASHRLRRYAISIWKA